MTPDVDLVRSQITQFAADNNISPFRDGIRLRHGAIDMANAMFPQDTPQKAWDVMRPIVERHMREIGAPQWGMEPDVYWREADADRGTGPGWCVYFRLGEPE